MTPKLNILQYIETGGPGGAETVLINLARHLDRGRFEPSVILHRTGWVSEQLAGYGIRTEIVPCSRSWDISFLRRFMRTCRQFKIDVIHSHLFGAGLYACLAGAILRLPVVVTFHNELFLPGRRERFLPLKNFLIRNLADRIVLVADYMRPEYVSRGKYSEAKMRTIYNGIEFPPGLPETEKDNLRNELKLGAGDPLVGHVANFRTPKGHHYLIEAAAEVTRRLPNVRFLLIGDLGDGSIRAEVEKLAAKHNIEKNVIILGFRSDVSRLLSLMDVFVLSSISEGHPLSVVEAMAAAKPVVVTNVGGLPEIVEDGHTGYLVEPKNPSALAEKITTLLSQPDFREQMGSRAVKAAEGRFSLDAMIRSYEQLFEEVAN